MSNPIIIFNNVSKKSKHHTDIEYILKITQETDEYWKEIKERILQFFPKSPYKYINLKKAFKKIKHKDDDIFLWIAHSAKNVLSQERFVLAIPKNIRKLVLTGRIT